MKLEEAIKILKYQINMKDTDVFITPNFDAVSTVLSYIEILETATNNKYPYVIGGRTLYGRLQQLTKEDLIKAYLRLRNEAKQLIKETENSIPKEKVEDIIRMWKEKDYVYGSEHLIQVLQELLEGK